MSVESLEKAILKMVKMALFSW